MVVEITTVSNPAKPEIDTSNFHCSTPDPAELENKETIFVSFAV